MSGSGSSSFIQTYDVDGSLDATLVNRFVKFVADGQVGLATDTGQESGVYAFWLDDGRCEVLLSGEAQIVAGETLIAGDRVTSGVTGKAVKNGLGSVMVTHGAATDGLVSVLLNPLPLKAETVINTVNTNITEVHFEDVAGVIPLSNATPDAVADGYAGVSGDASRADHRHGLATETVISLLGDAATDIDINNQKIVNVGTPTSAHDAATKAYVDAQVSAGGVTSYDFLLDNEPVSEGVACAVSYTNGKVTEELWTFIVGGLAVKRISYTYSSGRVATEVRKVYSPDGTTVVAQATWTYGYSAGHIVSDIMTRDV